MTIETTTVDTNEPVAAEPAADTTDAAPAKEAEREADGKFRKPVQPRIDELTRKARENEREAAYWRQRAESKEAKDAEAAKPVKPTPEKFTDYNAYVEALTDFKAGEKVDASLKARDTEQAARTKQQDFASSWASRVTDAKAKHADYEDVVSTSDVEVLDHVKDVINDSEVGPALIYHLAKNPDVAARLNKMSPLGAAREMGRLEDALAKTTETEPTETELAPEPAVAARKTSAAPAPVKPTASARSTKTDIASAGMDDYIKARKSAGARWAR